VVESVAAVALEGSTTETILEDAGIGSSLFKQEVQLPLLSTVKQLGGF
jgi:hypothetical protein